EYADRLERILRHLIELIHRVSAHALRIRTIEHPLLDRALHHELCYSSLQARSEVTTESVFRSQELEAGLSSHRKYRPCQMFLNERGKCACNCLLFRIGRFQVGFSELFFQSVDDDIGIGNLAT
ncbi:hypothetical protein PFISCL1PPCAC_18559, partial [Pristionchus fissidentatus]